MGGKKCQVHRADRVGGEIVTDRSRQSQEIARQREADDLPAPIGKQLVKPYDALEQIVKRCRHLLLGKHGLAGRKMDMATQMHQFTQVGLVERRADT